MKFNFKFRNKAEEIMVFIQEKSWAVTIFVFLVIFVSAVMIWRDCILNPRPSESALRNIENTEKEYQRKMEEIKKNNQELENQIKRFDNPISNLEENKNYFKPSEIKIPSAIEHSPEEKNFNPDLIN